MIKSYVYPNLGTGDSISYDIEFDDTVFKLDLEGYSSPDLIKEILRENTLEPTFRINILSWDEIKRGEIPLEDIKSGSYSENYQNGQRRALNFTLLNESGKYNPGINNFWAKTKFSFQVGFFSPYDDNVMLWFDKGVFVLNNSNPTQNANEKTVSFDCGDKFAVFESKLSTLDTTTEIEVGEDIENIFFDVLMQSTSDGDVLDPQFMIYHSSFKGKKTPVKISVSAGSTWANVFEQLSEILSAEIFYNVKGNLVIEPKFETTDDTTKPMIYHFLGYEGDFSSISLSLNFNDIVNKVVVVGANINGHTAIAQAINDDPSSPCCYQRIGLRTGSIINDSNITSDSLAKERADYELRKNLILKTNVPLSIRINPLLSVNTIIGITNLQHNINRERFVIQSLSFDIGYDANMSVTATNINNIGMVTGQKSGGVA